MADEHHVFCGYLFEALSEALKKYELYRRAEAQKAQQQRADEEREEERAHREWIARKCAEDPLFAQVYRERELSGVRPRPGHLSSRRTD
jgi:hypothetical protein